MLQDQIDHLGSTRSANTTKTDAVNSGLTFKVALIGPRQGGKTRISAQLAGRPVPPDTSYEPTAGVRILEFDEKVNATMKDGKKQFTSVKVELWDLSGEPDGDTNCWPAVVKDLLGVMVVFDPLSKQQANDVRIWCEWFCKSAQLRTHQCTIFAHGALTSKHKPLSVKAGLSGDKIEVSVPIVNVNYQLVQESADGQQKAKESRAKIEFNNFMGELYRFHPDA